MPSTRRADHDGDRPGGAPRPPAPRPIAPKPRALDDPASLQWAAGLWQRVMDREGLTLADLEAAAVEHELAA